MNATDNTARTQLPLFDAVSILAEEDVVTVEEVKKPSVARKSAKKVRAPRARKVAAPIIVEVAPVIVAPPAPIAAPVVEDVDPNTLTIVEQTKASFAQKDPWKRAGAIVGAVFGAWVPVAAFWASHHEVNKHADLYMQVSAWVVLACLAFSLPKVSKWATAAFGNGIAGVSFALLTEAIMVTFENPWVSMTGLTILVFINGVSGASNIALQRRKETF